MTESTHPTRDDQLEAYLDGLLDGDQLAAFEASLPSDPARRAAVQLQARIDASLGCVFRAAAPAEPQVTAMLSAATAAAPRRWATLAWTAAALAAAAAVGWALIGLPWGGERTDRLDFAARPLADVYREALANGFEPAYACSQAERFADTFARRQGQPLKLLALPVGVKMLGLAYPGGLSRDTTAMLCRVDGKPVMLFVDRVGADHESAVDHRDKAVHVFRTERNGLVFYEVTPLDKARVVDYLAPTSAAGASELPSAGAGAAA